MRLQWETDYALRCVLCLALKPNEWVRAAELADLVKVPEQMARKILTRLCTAGILEGKPGPKGGLRLALPAEKISVYDVVCCIEGEMCINRCLGPDGFCTRNGVPGCGVHRYLRSLQDQMEQSMRAMTFDLILAQNEEVVNAAGDLLEEASARMPGNEHLCPVLAEYQCRNASG